ncbi:MAG: hypothetical protein R6U44_09450 [Archaeoglobaceae archaeon]
MVEKKDVLNFIRKKCQEEGMETKPRIYEIARDLNAEENDIIEIVKGLESEGMIEYISSAPSESHICPVDLDLIFKDTLYEDR